MQDDEFLDAFAKDWRGVEYSSKMQSILHYVEKLTLTPARCGPEDIVTLRDCGWSEHAISDAVQVCSYFNYINRVALGLGVDEEDWLDALGRAIGE